MMSEHLLYSFPLNVNGKMQSRSGFGLLIDGPAVSLFSGSAKMKKES